MGYRFVLTAFSLAIGFAHGGAYAQDALKWQDVDCGQSKILAPAGLKCRASQVYTGDGQGKAGGQFQRWVSFGKTPDGSQVYYSGYEAVSPGSSFRLTGTLEDTVRGFSQSFRSAKDFTPVAQIGGGDYQRFTGPKGETCVAVRKLGGSQGGFFKWILLAGKCMAKGAVISDPDIAQFMSTTGFRS